MAINKNFVIKNGAEINTKLLVVDADTQRVGVGTTVASYTLHVFGTNEQPGGIGASVVNVTGVTTTILLNVSAAATFSNGPVFIGVGQSTGTPLQPLQVGSATTTKGIYVSGDVGIGETFPAAKLEVVPESTRTAGLFTGTTSDDMVRITQLGSGNALTIEDSANPDSTPVIVDASGDTGIGTDKARAKLHVLPNVNGIAGLFSGSTSNDMVRITQMGEGNALVVEDVVADGTPFIVKATGDTGIGIGSDPIGAKLHVVPSTPGIGGMFTGATAGDMVRITQTGGGNALVVEDEASPDATSFVISGLGSVGIGTNVPRYLLDVDGTKVAGEGLAIGQTAVYIRGDVKIVGDLSADDITLDQAVFTTINVTGFSTFGGSSATLLNVSGITTVGGGFEANQGINAARLNVTGITTLGFATAAALKVSGISTLGDTTVASAVVSGVSTFSGNVNLDGNIVTNVTIVSTDDGSSAAPEVKLYRDSASPADADYLGQIKFAGESDTGVERNYAKITGKIGDATNGTEDGIIEIAHIKDGSQSISARFNSTTLQLINGTELSVAGDATFSSDISVTGVSDFTGGVNAAQGAELARLNVTGISTLGFTTAAALKVSGISTLGDATVASAVVAGVSTFNGNVSIADKIIHTGDTDTAIRFPAADTFTVETGGSERVRVDSSGRVGIGTDNPLNGLDILQGTGRTRVNAFGHVITQNHNNSITNYWSFAPRDGGELDIGYGSPDGNGIVTGDILTLTTGGNVDINGTPPWTVTGGNYRNLSISGQDASSSGFLWLGNGAAATNADFDLGRINFVNGANIVAQIKGTTQTSANDDGRISFLTKSTGSNIAEKLRITSDGRFKIGSISDYSNNVTNCPVYIAMQTDITDFGDDEGGATAGLVRIEETGSNNNRYHGIDLRNTNSGDIRILNQDVGVSDRGDLVIAMPDEDASDGTHLKMRFNSMQSSIQISGKGGAVAGNTGTQHTDIYIATKTGVTAVDTGAGGEVAGLIRFEDVGSSNSRYHGIELRNRNSGDARILNLDEATTNKASLVFGTDNGTTVQERLRITSGGQIGVNKTTPKEWYSTYKTLQIYDAAYIAGSSDDSFVAIGANNYLDTGGTYDYTNTDDASQLYQVDGQLVFRNAPSGTANTPITWAERFKVTSGGNVGINETSPAYDLDVAGSIRAKGTGPGAGLLLHTNTGVTASANLMQIWSGQSSGFSFHTNSNGDGSNEVMRLTGAGQLNIGGNYTQNSYRLQVDGSIKGDYFTGESLSNRTGYKWGASGIYYLTLGGSRSGNASSFTMFELTGMNNSKFIEIQISFAHAGGGSHGSYRRSVYTSNAYQGLNTLENVTSNYGGGSGFTINKPSNGIVRVVWNGCTGFQDGFQLCCEVKTSNSGTVFQNVDSAFS